VIPIVIGWILIIIRFIAKKSSNAIGIRYPIGILDRILLNKGNSLDIKWREHFIYL
jgi:hypothetical protein